MKKPNSYICMFMYINVKFSIELTIYNALANNPHNYTSLRIKILIEVIYIKGGAKMICTPSKLLFLTAHWQCSSDNILDYLNIVDKVSTFCFK